MVLNKRWAPNIWSCWPYLRPLKARRFNNYQRTASGSAPPPSGWPPGPDEAAASSCGSLIKQASGRTAPTHFPTLGWFVAGSRHLFVFFFFPDSFPADSRRSAALKVSSPGCVWPPDGETHGQNSPWESKSGPCAGPDLLWFSLKASSVLAGAELGNKALVGR